MLRTFGRETLRRLVDGLPRRGLEVIAERIAQQDRSILTEALGPTFERKCTPDTMEVDLPPRGNEAVRFHHLADIFANTPLNHGVIAMTVRQAAYLYGLAEQLPVRKAIEIGRYKGGSTLVLAAAMGVDGTLWSVDLGTKEGRLREGEERPYDDQIEDKLDDLGLEAELLIGDSRTIEVETGEVDLVLIDGDHSYKGVKNDFERFGRRVRPGGAILFDDAVPYDGFSTHEDTVGRVVEELCQDDEFELVRTVNRMAHVERVERG